MQESPIFVRTFDLLIWLLPFTQKFPKEQRFVLAARHSPHHPTTNPHSRIKTGIQKLFTTHSQSRSLSCLHFGQPCLSLGSRLALNQSALPGVDRHLRPICEVEFAENIADVSLDRVLADEQFLGDLVVAKTICD